MCTPSKYFIDIVKGRNVGKQFPLLNYKFVITKDIIDISMEFHDKMFEVRKDHNDGVSACLSVKLYYLLTF